MTKGFDLNIEKVLENWEVSHALREIIANALDEQLLTNTAQIKIIKEGSVWIIRDYGRGLQPMHLTQNENGVFMKHQYYNNTYTEFAPE
jgi:DNA gyrase/topoisomerase IV subunit B